MISRKTLVKAGTITSHLLIKRDTTLLAEPDSLLHESASALSGIVMAVASHDSGLTSKLTDDNATFFIERSADIISNILTEQADKGNDITEAFCSTISGFISMKMCEQMEFVRKVIIPDVKEMVENIAQKVEGQGDPTHSLIKYATQIVDLPLEKEQAIRDIQSPELNDASLVYVPDDLAASMMKREAIATLFKNSEVITHTNPVELLARPEEIDYNDPIFIDKILFVCKAYEELYLAPYATTGFTSLQNKAIAGQILNCCLTQALVYIDAYNSCKSVVLTSVPGVNESVISTFTLKMSKIVLKAPVLAQIIEETGLLQDEVIEIIVGYLTTNEPLERLVPAFFTDSSLVADARAKYARLIAMFNSDTTVTSRGLAIDLIESAVFEFIPKIEVTASALNINFDPASFKRWVRVYLKNKGLGKDGSVSIASLSELDYTRIAIDLMVGEGYQMPVLADNLIRFNQFSPEESEYAYVGMIAEIVANFLTEQLNFKINREDD